MTMVTEEKFYLECPYMEKDEAKELGARCDLDAKKWYVPSDLDKNLFKKWWPGEVATDVIPFPG